MTRDLYVRWVVWASMCLGVCMVTTYLHAEVIVEQGTSRTVALGPDGKLRYQSDARGNRLPDFSHVGYRSGEHPIPDVPVVLTLSPAKGDNTERIQQAIDAVGKRPVNSQGFRGALLLRRGVYRVEGTLTIRHSGVVLRGEGSGQDGTLLIAAGYGQSHHKRTLITVGNNDSIRVDEASRQHIADDYVPIGTHRFTVESTDGYRVGDRIALHRPSTAEWISSIGCDRLRPKWTNVSDVRWVKDGPAPGLYFQRAGISHPQRIVKDPDEHWEDFQKRVPLSEDGRRLDVTRQWEPGEYDFYFERTITAIVGNRITIDAPVVHAMEARYGGGAVFHYDTPGRVTRVGIEHLRMFAEFAEAVKGHPFGDPRETGRAENHAWHAIMLSRNTEDTWVREVTAKYFGWSVVSASGTRATVQDCVSLGHASRIQGGRRYPFMISGQLNLVQRCLAIEGRHEFVSQQRTAGPNVFVDCLGQNSKSSAGPHHRYSIGTLFDNVKSEFFMESRFRGNSGTGHGWAGTQTCFYNSIAPEFRVQAPPGGISWVIGCANRYDPAQRVQPPSLYYQQVQDRLGREALNHVATPRQREMLGRFEWAKDLDASR